MLALGAGLVSSVQAQVRSDSTERRLTEAPPAAPDSVRPEDVSAPAAADTAESSRAIVNADSLSARTRNGQRIQDLFGNVFVRQDTTRLRSDYARRYLDSDRFLFTDNVVIYERGDTLRADTVRYNKATKVGRARGNVRVTDGEVVVRAPRATYYTESKRSVFPDSVTLVDSSRVLRAQQGTYWSEEKRAEFGGNVRLTDPETYLEADSLTYYRNTERSIARRNVFIRRVGDGEAAEEGAADADTTSRTYLFGAWADNQEQEGYSRVEGDALLMRVRFDSSGTPEDSLVVRAHRLDAYRSETHRRLVAIDSVRIWQADLAAVADSAVYDRVLAPGSPDTSASPLPPPDSAQGAAPAPPIASAEAPVEIGDVEPADSSAQPPGRVPSDTSRAPEQAAVPADTTSPSVQADSTAPDTSEAAASGLPSPTASWTRPTVDSAAGLPLEETRLFRAPVTWFQQAQVWGDSIRVRARNRSLDTVFVRGSAFAAQRDTSIDRIHQLKGRTLTAYFRADTLRRLLARPNAEAIRFLADDNEELSGGLQTSADRIVLRFRNGSVHRVSVLGGVESTLYQKPDLIPDPFRLEGFQWTPERKPTRRGLLDDPRIRQRLNLQREPPPVATGSASPNDERRRPPLDRTRQPVPPDSTQQAAPRPESFQQSDSDS